MEVLNLIQGKFISAKSGEWLDLTNPSKGKVYGRLPRSGSEDVNLAVESANKAFKSWSDTPSNDRAACLNRLADLVAKNAELLSCAESTDNGKPISLATSVDIPIFDSMPQQFSILLLSHTLWKGSQSITPLGSHWA